MVALDCYDKIYPNFLLSKMGQTNLSPYLLREIFFINTYGLVPKGQAKINRKNLFYDCNLYKICFDTSPDKAYKLVKSCVY